MLKRLQLMAIKLTLIIQPLHISYAQHTYMKKPFVNLPSTYKIRYDGYHFSLLLLLLFLLYF